MRQYDGATELCDNYLACLFTVRTFIRAMLFVMPINYDCVQVFLFTPHHTRPAGGLIDRRYVEQFNIVLHNAPASVTRIVTMMTLPHPSDRLFA